MNEITDKNHSGWNGVYNGTILPSNDYWYNAELIDSNGKVRKKTGHFSLLRK
ncbi:T9SS type B sorting domain-containing protein [Tenacibaculum sediminilitoris]|uniref:T9SS type B sorting domain-containing protein n=1 Tax=Tenacibaculum sediminilitoris TaxID=1820334 RepID=UPI0038B62604